MTNLVENIKQDYIQEVCLQYNEIRYGSDSSAEQINSLAYNRLKNF